MSTQKNIIEKGSFILNEGKRAFIELIKFTLYNTHENGTVLYMSRIEIGNIQGHRMNDIYIRYFKEEDFNWGLYNRHTQRLFESKLYRDNFDINNRTNPVKREGQLDYKMKKLIPALNKLSLVTLFSCQGTSNPWSDRPRPYDGHGAYAYIKFRDRYESFFEIVQNIGKEKIIINRMTIYSSTREFNKDFNSIILRAIRKYKREIERRG